MWKWDIHSCQDLIFKASTSNFETNKISILTKQDWLGVRCVR